MAFSSALHISKDLTLSSEGKRRGGRAIPPSENNNFLGQGQRGVLCSPQRKETRSLNILPPSASPGGSTPVLCNQTQTRRGIWQTWKGPTQLLLLASPCRSWTQGNKEIQAYLMRVGGNLQGWLGPGLEGEQSSSFFTSCLGLPQSFHSAISAQELAPCETQT